MSAHERRRPARESDLQQLVRVSSRVVFAKDSSNPKAPTDLYKVHGFVWRSKSKASWSGGTALERAHLAASPLCSEPTLQRRTTAIRAPPCLCNLLPVASYTSRLPVASLANACELAEVACVRPRTGAPLLL